MINAFHRTTRRVMEATLGLVICLFLITLPLGALADAARSSMSGNYTNDTVTVADKLKETIALSKDDVNKASADKEAKALITDYISRYRNRSQVNGSMSFTTMQTALNSMAGHYKTFPNRPIPEKLQDRLNKELEQAEQLALKGS